MFMMITNSDYKKIHIRLKQLIAYTHISKGQDQVLKVKKTFK